MTDILAIGELLAEIMAERVGQTFREPGVFLGPYPSGAPAIFADQAAKTGASVAFIGCMGKDGFGDLILDRLRQDGVDVTGIARTDKLPTGTAFVTYKEDGSREFIFNIGNSAAALIDADSVDPVLARGCRYFHVMGSSLGSAGSVAAVKRALDLVKQSGGKVSFDPNIRPEILASTVIREAIDLISDRSRYYWTDLEVEASVQVLLKNLSDRPPPMTVVSQFMPRQYSAVRAGTLSKDPVSLIRHRIGEVVSDYARACGLSAG